MMRSLDQSDGLTNCMQVSTRRTSGMRQHHSINAMISRHHAQTLQPACQAETSEEQQSDDDQEYQARSEYDERSSGKWRSSDERGRRTQQRKKRQSNFVSAFKNYRRGNLNRLRKFRWLCKMFHAFISGCVIEKRENQPGEVEIEPAGFFSEDNLRHFTEVHIDYSAQQEYREMREAATGDAVTALELPPHIFELWRICLQTKFSRWARTIVPSFDPNHAAPSPFWMDEAETDPDGIRLFSAQAETARAETQDSAKSLGRCFLHWAHACALVFSDTGSFAASQPVNVIEDDEQLQERLTEETGGLNLWNYLQCTREMAVSLARTFQTNETCWITEDASEDMIIKAMDDLVKVWTAASKRRVIQQESVDSLCAWAVDHKLPAVSKSSQQGLVGRKVPNKAASAAAAQTAAAAATVAPSATAAVPAAVSAMVDRAVFPGFGRIHELIAAQAKVVSEPLMRLLQERCVRVFFCLLL